MAKQYKNDIFEVLKQIDNKNYQYYESLSVEQQKEIQPYTLLRWLSSLAGNEQDHIKYTLETNEKVNKRFWELSKYKDLQWKLLCSCGSKKFIRHQWIPMSKTNKDKNYNMLRKFYSNLNDDEFEMKYREMTSNDIKDVQKFLGILDK